LIDGWPRPDCRGCLCFEGLTTRSLVSGSWWFALWAFVCSLTI